MSLATKLPSIWMSPTTKWHFNSVLLATKFTLCHYPPKINFLTFSVTFILPFVLLCKKKIFCCCIYHLAMELYIKVILVYYWNFLIFVILILDGKKNIFLYFFNKIVSLKFSNSLSWPFLNTSQDCKIISDLGFANRLTFHLSIGFIALIAEAFNDSCRPGVAGAVLQSPLFN